MILSFTQVADSRQRRTELHKTHLDLQARLFGGYYFRFYKPKDPQTHGAVLMLTVRSPFTGHFPAYELVLPAGDPTCFGAWLSLQTPLGQIAIHVVGWFLGDRKNQQEVVARVQNPDRPDHWSAIFYRAWEKGPELFQTPLDWILASAEFIEGMTAVPESGRSHFTSKDPAVPWKISVVGYRPKAGEPDGLYLTVDTWGTAIRADETVWAVYELAVARKPDGSAVIVDLLINTGTIEGEMHWLVALTERGTVRQTTFAYPFKRGGSVKKIKA